MMAQPHQNIANRSNKQINDTVKKAYSHIYAYTLLNLLAYYGHGISNMVYILHIFHFPY